MGVSYKDYRKYKRSITLLQIDSWSDYDGGIVSKRLLDQLDTGIYWLNEVGNKLNELSKLSLETGKAQSVIENIKGSVRMLLLSSWDDFKGGYINRETLSQLNSSIISITEVGRSLSKLAEISLDAEKINKTIEAVKGPLRMFQFENWKDYNKGVVKADFLKALGIIVENFFILSNRINELSGVAIDVKLFMKLLQQLKV